MENASKALLIAGAILIAIVLISVGMVVLNSTTDVTDQVGDITTSQAAQTFNKNFDTYAGTQKGSSVRSLLGAIAASNKTNGAGKKITVTFAGIDGGSSDDGSKITTSMSSVVNSSNYTVKITGMDTDGYISTISITQITPTTE